MSSIILMIVLFVVAIAVSFISLYPALNAIKRIAMIALTAFGVLVGGLGAFGYNDAGYCQHVRTVFGTETSTCSTGWYFAGWGTATEWPHYITVANTLDMASEGSAISGPYRVRMADNWTGDVVQTTRFQIPRDQSQFLTMARTFRSPERLISTTLKPAVTSSIDSVANMFSMEEYYAGGKRDQFKNEFKDTVERGRAQVRQISLNQSGGVVRNRNTPNDLAATEDTSEIGDTDVRRVIMEKVTDNAGQDIRTAHDYSEIGVVVASAILENLDPDDKFEEQIQARKEAASRRIVAREQRLEQEEQRLLAIQEGETNIARRQAAAKTEQIQATTDAETKKQLALIEASRVIEEAAISRDTAAINLERARIDAEAVTVAADAEAYAKEAILEADGALAQKLDAWVSAQKVWADAASKINVPSTVFNNGGAEGVAGNALGTVDQFMQMMMMKTARDLQVDPTIRPAK